MRKSVVLVALLAAAVIVSQTRVGAQGTRAVEAQFRAAQYKIEVQGDVVGAIADYRRIAEGADRTAAARALLEMGLAYQRFGGGDPANVLTRLRREFGDQPAVVAEATAALSPATAEQGMTLRQLTTGTVFAHDISPDGRVALGLANTGTVQGVVLQDVATGETTLVVAGDNSPSSRTSMNDPVFSNDGRQIAYRMTAPNRQTPSGFLSTIHVVDARASATPRTIVADDPGRPGPIYPIGWSIDDRSVLTYTDVTREGHALPQGSVLLDWVAVEDSSSTRVASFEPWRNVSWLRLAPRNGLSPDGTLLAFTAVAREGSDDRALFVLDVRDGSEAPVVQMAGQHFDPVWTPDGAHLLFASNRSGSRALWAVPMRAEHATGAPFQVKPDIGRIVGISQAGDLFEEQAYGGGQQVFMADLLSTANGRISSYFQGEGVAWSPDKQLLAYLRRAQNALSVVVRSLATGEERTFSREGLGASQLRWVAGSDSLLVQVNAAGDGGRQGGSEYLLDTRTGEFEWLLARLTGDVHRQPVAEVSPDGRTVYMITRQGQGGPPTGIVAIDIATKQERRVATFGAGFPETGGGIGLAISPDGTTLVVQTQAEEADPPRTFLARLFLVRTDGSGYQPLYGPFPVSTNPSITRWTPDGQSILFFITERDGHWRLMRVSPAGGDPTFAGLDSTNLQSDVRMPVLVPVSPLSLDISPDGTKIAFGASTSLTRELWVHEGIASRLGLP